MSPFGFAVIRSPARAKSVAGYLTYAASLELFPPCRRGKHDLPSTCSQRSFLLDVTARFSLLDRRHSAHLLLRVAHFAQEIELVHVV